MRKVKISVWVSEEKVEGTNEIKPGTGCKVLFKEEGYFHRWIACQSSLYGIIEKLDGTISKVYYGDIKFEPITRLKKEAPLNAGGFPADVLPFEDIAIGMEAFHCSSDEHDESEGIILWKGKWSEWIKEFPDRQNEWEEPEQMSIEEMDENYDLVLVETNEGDILFNYNNDPSGVYCKK
jgi:hypothetical protein